MALKFRIVQCFFISVLSVATPLSAAENGDQAPRYGEPEICDAILGRIALSRFSIYFWNEYYRFATSVAFPSGWVQNSNIKRYMGRRLPLIGRQIPLNEEIEMEADLRRIYPDDKFKVYRILKGDYFKAATDTINPFLDKWDLTLRESQGLSTGRATVFDVNYDKQGVYVGDYVVVNRETSLVVAIFDFAAKVITPFIIRH